MTARVVAIGGGKGGVGKSLVAATLGIFLAADVQLIVAVPDPTSIELMHRFVKAAFLAKLAQAGLAHLAPPAKHHEGGAPSALEVYLSAVERAPDVEVSALRDTIL